MYLRRHPLALLCAGARGGAGAGGAGLASGRRQGALRPPPRGEGEVRSMCPGRNPEAGLRSWDDAAPLHRSKPVRADHLPPSL